jgi:4a-hydroxytetrahydrobiopterin dehydratase
MPKVLTGQELNAALADRPHWELRDGALFRAVQAPSFRDGIRLVDEVALAAEEADHHPDIDIRWTTVSFALQTHSAGGITGNDLDLAARIDSIVDRVVRPG